MKYNKDYKFSTLNSLNPYNRYVILFLFFHFFLPCSTNTTWWCIPPVFLSFNTLHVCIARLKSFYFLMLLFLIMILFNFFIIRFTIGSSFFGLIICLYTCCTRCGLIIRFNILAFVYLRLVIIWIILIRLHAYVFLFSPKIIFFTPSNRNNWIHFVILTNIIRTK